MKKIILFSLLIFTSIPGFTYDYREILFGNNYENITECTDNEILKYFKNQKAYEMGSMEINMYVFLKKIMKMELSIGF